VSTEFQYGSFGRMSKIQLTQTVQKGGCAAKVAASELKTILNAVTFPPVHKNLIIDGSTMDDAGVYRVNDQLALVQTLDFFTPIVDSPYQFGQIAAANALSDVYAMGGVPKTAMAILAFPLTQLSNEVISAVMQGASDKIAESGACLVGGHSIDDDTLKFGLSVTGYVHPEKIWSNAKAKVGDDIILIKPIGTGAATAALKRQVVTESDISDALQSMSQLNMIMDLIDESSELTAIHAATDLTGFGLCGHAMQMAKASGVSLQIDFKKVPLFSKTLEFLESGMITKAHRTNREYTASDIDISCLTESEALAVFDPQTSGGLFLTVDPVVSKNILKKLQGRFVHAEIIGSVIEKNQKSIYFSK
jgi:selenide,water dikinase